MRPVPPITVLGLEARRRRAKDGQPAAAVLIGIPRTTLAGIERGAHTPSIDTARKLAAWLGWTLEAVFEAAETPAEDPGRPCL